MMRDKDEPSAVRVYTVCDESRYKKKPLQVHAKGWSNNFVFFLYVGLPRDLFIYLFNVHEKSIMYAF